MSSNLFLNYGLLTIYQLNYVSSRLYSNLQSDIIVKQHGIGSVTYVYDSFLDGAKGIIWAEYGSVYIQNSIFNDISTLFYVKNGDTVVVRNCMAQNIGYKLSRFAKSGRSGIYSTVIDNTNNVILEDNIFIFNHLTQFS
eukprot:407972_1